MLPQFIMPLLKSAVLPLDVVKWSLEVRVALRRGLWIGIRLRVDDQLLPARHAKNLRSGYRLQ